MPAIICKSKGWNSPLSRQKLFSNQISIQSMRESKRQQQERALERANIVRHRRDDFTSKQSQSLISPSARREQKSASDSHFISTTQSLIYFARYHHHRQKVYWYRDWAFLLIHPDTFYNNKKAISPHLFAFYDEFHWFRRSPGNWESANDKRVHVGLPFAVKS